jgi:hypothetical protein
MGHIPMRRMIVRMIATGSLSAFSSAALQGLPSQSGRIGGGAGAVQQARTTPVQPQVQPAPQVPLDQGKAGAQPTGRVLPRGSLLDLSV